MNRILENPSIFYGVLKIKRFRRAEPRDLSLSLGFESMGIFDVFSSFPSSLYGKISTFEAL